MTAPHFYSPSQLSTANECLRKWAWRTIAKVESTTHASAALGTETHSQLEGYLSGKPLDFTRDSGYIAAAGLQYLPQPNAPGMQLEEDFAFESPRFGLMYRGFIDLLARDGAIVPGGQAGVPVVMDHKTTSNFNYAKTPDDLKKDPQGVIYAVAAMSRFQAPIVDLVWVYYLTKGAKKSKRVHLRVHSDDVAREFEQIELGASKLQQILDSGQRVADPAAFVLSLPPSPGACESYGGCSYRHLCNLSPRDKARSIMQAGTNALFARLQAQNPTATPAPATPPTPTGVTFNDSWRAADQQPPTPAAAAPVAINPPEFQPEIPLEAPTAAEVPAAKRTRRTKAQMQADAQPTLNVAAEMNAQPTQGFGNPIIGAPGVPVLDHPNAPPPAPITTIHVTAPKEMGFTLYVDCAPVGIPYTEACHILALAKTQVCAELKTPDYRLGAGEYGKGAAYLSKVFADLVANGSYGDISIDSSTPEAGAVLVALQSQASLVVRGLR